MQNGFNPEKQITEVLHKNISYPFFVKTLITFSSCEDYFSNKESKTYSNNVTFSTRKEQPGFTGLSVLQTLKIGKPFAQCLVLQIWCWVRDCEHLEG